MKKGLFLGDDSVWHQVNLITAAACDFVLTDPVSSLKFNELGINSMFSNVEGNEDIFKDYKTILIKINQGLVHFICLK